MAISQGIVIDPSGGSSSDGSIQQINLGRANETIISQLHGKYFEQAYRGNIFYASTASAGVVLPIASSTTPTYSLWNPAGSGKLMVPIVLLIGWTATTAALGEIIWTATTNAGSGISSTAPFVAFGTGAGVNANLGSGKVSQMRTATGGTTTLVAAGIFYRSTGLSITVTASNTTVAPGWVWRDDFDGTSVVPPGNAIHLMGTTAIAITGTITTVYAEIPL